MRYVLFVKEGKRAVRRAVWEEELDVATALFREEERYGKPKALVGRIAIIRQLGHSSDGGL